jgi:hypothetical protein
VADELHELKDRLAELSTALDELLARQQGGQPGGPAPEPPSTSEA